MLNVTAGASVRLLTVFSGAGGFLQRRCCSAVTAACSWSSSSSLRCLIAAGRSLGRICRDDVVGLGGREAVSCGDAVENRSGVAVDPVRSPPIWQQSCRRLRGVATEVQRNTAQSPTARQRLRFGSHAVCKWGKERRRPSALLSAFSEDRRLTRS
jgi:hypothetical protein